MSRTVRRSPPSTPGVPQLFVLDEHGDYVPLRPSDPLYQALERLSSQGALSSQAADESVLALFLSDVQSISWSTVKELVLRPMLHGLVFGMGSYASRYLVHALMVRYSDWHVQAPAVGDPPTTSSQHQQPQDAPPPTAAGSAGEAAAAATPGVAAEAFAYQVGQEMAATGAAAGGGAEQGLGSHWLQHVGVTR